MSRSILSAGSFHNERAAYKFVEAHIWPDGPVCFHCGATKKNVRKLKGKSTRVGLYKCYSCRKPFTVKMGTVLESSHVPMRLWLQAIYLLCASQPVLRVHRRIRLGLGAHPVLRSGSITIRELQRTFGIGLKTAWFMSRRIRAAMKHPERPPSEQTLLRLLRG